MLDQQARASAAAVRSRYETIAVPEPTALIARAGRRRRTTLAIALVLVVGVGVGATIVVVAREDHTSRRVEAVGRPPANLPRGAVVDGDWTAIPKGSAGLGASATLSTVATNGSTVLVAGAGGGARTGGAGIWRSGDGLTWSEADHPRAAPAISAIALHGATAIVVSAPGETEPFVWRSDDEGRRWREVARGQLFGRPVPNNRPGAFVSGLGWHDGWWVAYGGAADGYEGIWISRDGSDWETVLDSMTSGGIDGITKLDDGSLMAYGADSRGQYSSASVGWFTDDPTHWGSPRPLSVPEPYYLASVASGASFAVGAGLDQHGDATVLRSSDDGQTWVEDPAFDFPRAQPITATRSGGLDIVSGTDFNGGLAEPGPPRVWTAQATEPWVSSLPERFRSPTPSTTVPQRPPAAALTLVVTVGSRVLLMSRDPAVDRYYALEAG